MRNLLSAFFVFFLFAFGTVCLSAQNQGKIVFIGFNADGDDGFAILTLVDIPAGDKLYFTDKNWDGSSFNGSEGEIEWENNTGGVISEGTIITFNPIDPTTVDVGNIVSETGTFNVSGSNEAIWILTADPSVASQSHFIAVIANEEDAALGPDLTNTGLIEGVSAAEIDGDADVMTYDGANGTDCTGMTLTQCATMFNTASNWITQNTNMDDHNDMVAPDFPDDVITSATIPSTYGILPINLIRFYGISENQKVQLFWTTASEINNKFFTIEHSFDGKLFEEIGIVYGVGNSNEIHEYNFTHQTPQKGINYYRLKQIDFDGQYTYSPIVTMEFREAGSFKISPNPFRNELELSFDQVLEFETETEVYNLSGQLIFKQITEPGSISQILNFENQPSGMYLLKICSDRNLQTVRIFKTAN